MNQSSPEFELLSTNEAKQLPVFSMGTMQPHRLRGIFALLGVCLVFYPPQHCDGGNILVFPFDGSHWINMNVLLEELHARGHHLTVIRGSTSWYIAEKSPLYKSITVGISEDMECLFDTFLQKHMQHQTGGGSPFLFFKLVMSFRSMISRTHSVWTEAMVKLLEDEAMMKALKDSHYDLVLTDPGMAHGLVLAKLLKLPLVLNVRWILNGDGHIAIAPTPLSYVPMQGSGLTHRMTFMQRIKNLFFFSLQQIVATFTFQGQYNAICDKYIEGGCDIFSLHQEADIWLFRSDFVFDFPRPTMPNVVYIGGFQCKPAQPLPADLEDFVQSAGEHGVIIMTLGTLINALPKEVAEEVAGVFAKMPQKVIWKHKGERPSTLGNNTLIVDWMPQRDLLGHPQTKVFVAHGGTNGVQEAIYYGVPVLGIPLFFDQFDNLLRLKDRGAGKILRLGDVNGHSFEQGLTKVLYEDRYRENMQRLSRLHRDQPIAPMDKAIFWVEYVMRHKGAPHLRTEAYKMPWYSYYSLDVIVLLLTVFTVLLLSVLTLFRFLCYRCRRKTKTKRH